MNLNLRYPTRQRRIERETQKYFDNILKYNKEYGNLDFLYHKNNFYDRDQFEQYFKCFKENYYNLKEKENLSNNNPYLRLLNFYKNLEFEDKKKKDDQNATSIYGPTLVNNNSTKSEKEHNRDNDENESKNRNVNKKAKRNDNEEDDVKILTNKTMSHMYSISDLSSSSENIKELNDMDESTNTNHIKYHVYNNYKDPTPELCPKLLCFERNHYVPPPPPTLMLFCKNNPKEKIKKEVINKKKDDKMSSQIDSNSINVKISKRDINKKPNHSDKQFYNNYIINKNIPRKQQENNNGKNKTIRNVEFNCNYLPGESDLEKDIDKKSNINNCCYNKIPIKNEPGEIKNENINNNDNNYYNDNNEDYKQNIDIYLNTRDDAEIETKFDSDAESDSELDTISDSSLVIDDGTNIEESIKKVKNKMHELNKKKIKVLDKHYSHYPTINESINQWRWRKVHNKLLGKF